jgi:3-mercaptopyruvate sulfurtransferase SseA
MIQAGDKTPQDFIKEAKADVQAVSIHDVKQLIDTGKKVIILDVRDKEEFEKSISRVR